MVVASTVGAGSHGDYPARLGHLEFIWVDLTTWILSSFVFILTIFLVILSFRFYYKANFYAYFINKLNKKKILSL